MKIDLYAVLDSRTKVTAITLKVDGETVYQATGQFTSDRTPTLQQILSLVAKMKT